MTSADVSAARAHLAPKPEKDKVGDGIGRRAMVPLWVIQKLAPYPPALLTVYVVIAAYCSNGEGAFPHIATLATACGLSEGAVARAINGRTGKKPEPGLIDLGLLEKFPRVFPGRGKIGNEYRLTVVQPLEKPIAPQGALGGPIAPPGAEPIAPPGAFVRGEQTSKEQRERSRAKAQEPAPLERDLELPEQSEEVTHTGHAENFPGIPGPKMSKVSTNPTTAKAQEITTRVFGNRKPKPLPKFLNVRSLAEKCLEAEWSPEDVEAAMMRPDTVFTLAGMEVAYGHREKPQDDTEPVDPRMGYDFPEPPAWITDERPGEAEKRSELIASLGWEGRTPQ